MSESKDIVVRLGDAFAELATCHCGESRKHGHCDNHSFVWNPCPDTQLLQDAIVEITRLRSDLAAMRDELDMYKDDLQRTESRLSAALDELRCPDCKCGDEVDAQSSECGCDSPLCMRNDGKTLAKSWLEMYNRLGKEKIE